MQHTSHDILVSGTIYTWHFVLVTLTGQLIFVVAHFYSFHMHLLA